MAHVRRKPVMREMMTKKLMSAAAPPMLTDAAEGSSEGAPSRRMELRMGGISRFPYWV